MSLGIVEIWKAFLLVDTAIDVLGREQWTVVLLIGLPVCVLEAA